MKLEELEVSPLYIHALIYGEFGVGKTFLCGTAADHPDMLPMLLVRAEDGALTIKHKDVQATPLIKCIADIDEVFWALAQKKKGWEFKTVVIDSLSALLQTVLREVVDNNCKKNPNKDPNLPSQHDYGQMTFIMKRLIRRFTELPMHVMFTALLAKFYNTEDPTEQMSRGPVLCTPDLTPKVRNDAMAAVDFLWPLQAKKDGTRVILTEKQGAWLAKTRGELFAKQLGAQVENPTIPKLFETLKGAR